MSNLRVTQILVCATLVSVSGCARSIGPGIGRETVDATAQAGAERDVLASEHDWVKVALAGDADTFASLLADTYVELNPRGQFIDKATWTERLRSGRSHYSSVDLRDLLVRFPTPEVAVVTGAFSQTAISEGKDNSASGTYVNTWVRMGGRWQVVSSGFVFAPTALPH